VRLPARWAGFDKPQRIFSGAFGRDITLRLWVDVMNASRTLSAEGHFAARGLERVNICANLDCLPTDNALRKSKNE